MLALLNSTFAEECKLAPVKDAFDTIARLAGVVMSPPRRPVFTANVFADMMPTRFELPVVVDPVVLACAVTTLFDIDVANWFVMFTQLRNVSVVTTTLETEIVIYFALLIISLTEIGCRSFLVLSLPHLV